MRCHSTNCCYRSEETIIRTPSPLAKPESETRAPPEPENGKRRTLNRIGEGTERGKDRQWAETGLLAVTTEGQVSGISEETPSRTFWKYTSKEILSVIRMRWRMTIGESDTRRKSIPFYKNAFVKRTVPRSFFILMGKHSTWHDLYQTNLFILVWSISSIYLLSMGKYWDQGKQFLF